MWHFKSTDLSFQCLGACADGGAPRTRTDLRGPKATYHRELSDAALRIHLALGVRRPEKLLKINVRFGQGAVRDFETTDRDKKSQDACAGDADMHR